MKNLLLSIIILVMLVPCMFTQDTQTIKFDLFLKYADNENYKMSFPYSMAFDKKESVYILDIKECSVLKFDVNGKFITSIGKKGNGPGEIHFPAGISVKDNYIYLIDYFPIINLYNTSGKFISSTTKQRTSVQDIKEFPGKFFIGTEYNAEKLIVSLGKYDWAGKLISVIDKINYSHYFAQKELAEPKSFAYSNVETITYCIDKGGEILFAKTNKYEIKKYFDGKAKVIISEDRKVKKLPNMKGVSAKVEKTKHGPVLHLIGNSFDLVQDLMTDTENNIWFYTTSEDRSGFVKYSAEGKYKGFYKMSPSFFTVAHFYMSKDYIYHIYRSSEKIEIYRAAIPK